MNPVAKMNQEIETQGRVVTYEDIQFQRCEKYLFFIELCIKGKVEELSNFVEENNFDVNNIDYDLFTLKIDRPLPMKSGLFCAAMNGNFKTCERLLEWGADINYADEYGRTALHAALAGKEIVNNPIDAYDGRDRSAWRADRRFFRDTIGTVEEYDFVYYSKDVEHWEREIKTSDWHTTAKMFLTHPDCKRDEKCGRKHPIWFAALEQMPFDIARTIMTFPEYNGPEDWKAKGDLAFQLICNDQRQKFQYCLETGILKKDFVLLEENLLGRILNQARPELLKIYLSYRDVEVHTIGVSGWWTSYDSISFLLALASNEEVGTSAMRSLDDARDDWFDCFKILLHDERVKLDNALIVRKAARINDHRYLLELQEHRGIDFTTRKVLKAALRQTRPSKWMRFKTQVSKMARSTIRLLNCGCN